MLTSSRIYRTQNEEFLHRSIAHAHYVERFTTHEVNKIVGFMNDSVVPGMLDKLKKVINESKGQRKFKILKGITTRKNLQRMTVAANDIVRVGVRALKNRLKGDLQGLAWTEAEWQHSILSKAGKGVDIEFHMPSLSVIKRVVTSSPINGRLFGTWFNGLSTSVAGNVNQQIGLGLATGETVPQIIKRIEGVQGTGVVGSARRHVATLVRTSVNHVSNAARELTFDTEVVGKIKLVATLDGRTTFFCMGIDGDIYPVGEGPRPPFHMQCRTIVSPIMKSWKELGINLKEAPAGTRASFSGQVPKNITYPDWLKKQSKKFQNEALGPVRADLWRKGKVKISAFSNNAAQPLNLEQLRAKEGLKPLKKKLIK